MQPLIRNFFDQGSLDCLKTRGYMVSFGQSSGSPDPVPLSALAVKSLFLTRPSMMHYTMTRDELLETAGEVFANVASGVLRVRVNHTYPLSQAAQAHTDLESRKTSGSVVLIPDDAQQQFTLYTANMKYIKGILDFKSELNHNKCLCASFADLYFSLCNNSVLYLPVVVLRGCCVQFPAFCK